MGIALLAMTSAVAIVAVAGAAPVTLEFSGVFSAGKPADVGKIESVYIQPTGHGTVAGLGLSTSGCQRSKRSQWPSGLAERDLAVCT